MYGKSPFQGYEIGMQRQPRVPLRYTLGCEYFVPSGLSAWFHGVTRKDLSVQI